MLNQSDKFIVYLDPDTLGYMFLSYTKRRNYPVMNKLFSLLAEGFKNNYLITPLSTDHFLPYIAENQIDRAFLTMIGKLGQLQFHQRFTVRMLQLIRVITYFFEQHYTREIWRDAFTSDPDERLVQGFNKYSSITAPNVIQANEREKKLSQVYDFINRIKNGQTVDTIASDYFKILWEQFPDIIRPYLPSDGSPEYHMKQFFDFKEIKDIPEFHIISTILFPLFEAHGIEEVENGSCDSVLLAAETFSAYMPYSHFYVTTGDIAELIITTGVNTVYNVRIYDNNESSLYQLIEDITEAVKTKRQEKKKTSSKTIYHRGGSSKGFYR